MARGGEGPVTADALLVHAIDQEAAEIRDYASDYDIAIHQPEVSRAIRLVTDWILCAGKLAEPDGEQVASAMFLMASAWREVCAE